jgi:hypothetical protein
VNLKETLHNIKSNLGKSFVVAYKNKQGNWSRWLELDDWYSKFDYDPNYRQILPNEIVVETDLSREENEVIANKIIKILNKNNFSYLNYFTGNKSYHIHLFFDDLNNFEDRKRTFLKKEWLKYYFDKEDYFVLIDSTNFGARSLIQIPGSVNQKTGKTKSLIESSSKSSLNLMPADIIRKSMKIGGFKFKNKHSNAPDFCGACELALREKFPAGNRHHAVSANIVPYLKQFKNYDDLKKKYLQTQFDGKRERDLKGWEDKDSSFNCPQLQTYMREHKKGKICDLCLLEGII